MATIDRTDLVSGLSLASLGAAMSYTAIVHYPLGSLKFMGAGVFPAGLGLLLVILGTWIAIASFGRAGNVTAIRVFSPLFILSGVGAFAIFIEPFGLIPTIVITTLIASMAELKINLVSVSLLCLTLSIIAPAIFVGLLDLQIALVNWPF